jgi:hypothetical protein
VLASKVHYPMGDDPKHRGNAAGHLERESAPPVSRRALCRLNDGT